MGLTLIGVVDRRKRLKIELPRKAFPVVIGEIKPVGEVKLERKQKPGPKPRPLCPWPSGNPAREMHICCRVPETGDIRCDDAA